MKRMLWLLKIFVVLGLLISLIAPNGFAQIGQITRRLIGIQDMAPWDGVSRTFNYTDSAGNLLTLNRVGNEVDVCAAYGSGFNTTQAVLQAAITAVGTTNKMTFVLAPGTWTISADQTIPANICLKPARGAILSVAVGKTLTINGPFESGPYQVFSCAGTGKVVFGAGAVEKVHPEWWTTNTTPGTTNMTAAVQAALNSLAIAKGTVSLLGADYAVSAPVNVLYDKITLKGSGRRASRIINTSTTTNAITIGDGSHSPNQVLISELSIEAKSAMTAGAGIDVAYGYDVRVSGVGIYDHFKGVNITGWSFIYLDNVWILYSAFAPPSGCVGIDIGGGNDIFISHVFADATVYSNNPTAGLRVTKVSGLWVNDCDFVLMGCGLFVNPGGTDIVEFCYLSDVTFDSSYRAGILLAAGATAKIAGLQFTGCMTSSSGITSSTPTWANEPGVYMVGPGVMSDIRFVGHRSIYNGGAGFFMANGDNWSILDSTVSGNGKSSVGTINGIHVAADVSGFQIANTRSGPCGRPDIGLDIQAYGINIAAGASDHYTINSNDVRGNLSGRISDNGTGKAKRISGNAGYNPIGPYTEAVPGSGATFINTLGSDATVVVGGGTVTKIEIGGLVVGLVDTGFTSGTFSVPAGGSIRLTYSSVPTWFWSYN